MVISFDRDDIRSALEELVEHLVAAQASSHIRIVGGAAIAIRFHRDTTTTDVDALYGHDLRVEAAAQQIARARGWPDTWLNEDVQMWTSHFDEPDDWEQLLARDEVTVEVASTPLLLAMKLRAPGADGTPLTSKSSWMHATSRASPR